MRTTRFNIGGENQAKYICLNLIEHSQWFLFEPLPDDRYEVEVKDENISLVKKLQRNYLQIIQEDEEHAAED